MAARSRWFVLTALGMVALLAFFTGRQVEEHGHRRLLTLVVDLQGAHGGFELGDRAERNCRA